MTPGISFSTDLSVLHYVDSTGAKTDISILNGKAAKITASNGAITATEVSSLPGNGDSYKVPLANTFVLVGYRPSNNRCYIVGEVDIPAGISVRSHPVDMSNGKELYLSVNSGNELVVVTV